MVSLRQFTRILKNKPPENDEQLIEIIKQFQAPASYSGIMSLEHLIIGQIRNPKIHFKTLLELFNVINIVAPKVSNAARAKQLYTALRKETKLRFPDVNGEQSDEYKKTYDAMRLNDEFYADKNSAYAAKVKAKNVLKRQYDGEDLIKIIHTLRTSPLYELKIILMMLASGARISEALHFSTFARVNDTYIKQTGIEKSKTRQEVIKPILYINTGEFIELYNATRQKTIQAIPRVNAYVKKLFGEGTTSHDLRKIYADVSYRLYADVKNVSQSAYVSMMLGHEENDMTTANPYTVSYVNIDDIERLRRVGAALTKEGEKKKDDTVVNKSDEEIPRNLTVRDGKAGERLKLTVQALENAGIAYTARSLLAYGYGARVIREFYKGKKT